MPAQAPRPPQSPNRPIGAGDIVQAVFDMHMDTAEDAGLLQEPPLHRMASFLSSEPGKGYLFDVMASNTADGPQNRVIVMATEDRDGTSVLTTPLEEFRWHEAGMEETLAVSHVSHDPALGYFGPEQALGRLAHLLRTQGMPPTELTFAED